MGATTVRDIGVFCFKIDGDPNVFTYEVYKVIVITRVSSIEKPQLVNYLLKDIPKFSMGNRIIVDL